MPVTIRPAHERDVPTIVRFVRDLADYEKLSHEVTSTEADFAVALFGKSPRVFAEIAENDGVPIGFSLWFYTFSTFQGRLGIWLEDLYVVPQARGLGAGRLLLKRLARRCLEERLGRLEWWVLDWNAPAIAFYEAHGAVLEDDWTKCRVSGEALERLGA